MITNSKLRQASKRRRFVEDRDAYNPYMQLKEKENEIRHIVQDIADGSITEEEGREAIMAEMSDMAPLGHLIEEVKNEILADSRDLPAASLIASESAALCSLVNDVDSNSEFISKLKVELREKLESNAQGRAALKIINRFGQGGDGTLDEAFINMLFAHGYAPEYLDVGNGRRMLWTQENVDMLDDFFKLFGHDGVEMVNLAGGFIVLKSRGKELGIIANSRHDKVIVPEGKKGHTTLTIATIPSVTSFIKADLLSEVVLYRYGN